MNSFKNLYFFSKVPPHAHYYPSDRTKDSSGTYNSTDTLNESNANFGTKSSTGGYVYLSNGTEIDLGTYGATAGNGNVSEISNLSITYNIHMVNKRIDK